MKKTQLQILLSKLKDVEEKKPGLEQYQTPPDIAAEVLVQAQVAGDLNGNVVDLGTGNGIFALGAAILGAEQVCGYDVDEASIEVSKQNKELVEEELNRELPVTFEAKDLHQISESADAIIMNPPFGIQRGNRQINKTFLTKAFELAPVVYTLMHQSEDKRGETRDHLQTLASSYDFDSTILAWFYFPIPRTYEFHEKDKEEVKVDLYKFFKLQ